MNGARVKDVDRVVDGIKDIAMGTSAAWDQARQAGQANWAAWVDWGARRRTGIPREEMVGDR